MCPKSVTVLIKKKKKNILEKHYDPSHKKSEKLKNGLKKSYLKPWFSIMLKMFSHTALVCSRNCFYIRDRVFVIFLNEIMGLQNSHNSFT